MPGSLRAQGRSARRGSRGRVRPLHLRPAPVRAPARLAPPSPVLTAQARGRERGASRDSRVAGCGAWRFCGLRSASSGGSQAEVTRRSKPSLPAPPTAWAMETQVLTPHVYWAQRHRELYLRVELSDVQVKARLPAARGIAAPGYPPPALLVCAPAVRQWAPRVGCPAFPQGCRCHRGVPRVAPRLPLCSWQAPWGAAAGSWRHGRRLAACPRPSETWDELCGSEVRRDSGLLGRDWTSALVSEVQLGRPTDVLKARH